MKKTRIIKPKNNLKTRWTTRQSKFKEKSLNLAHPVVKASYIWSILTEQLGDVLGPEVHHQWFKQVKPLVISHNVLILEVPNHFSAQWIHTHYHELVDVLLSVMDKKLTSFFVSQSERHQAPKLVRNLTESSASEVKRQAEDEHSKK
ncbi:MAG TPA: DnaA N-terminal domain-containing protein [Bacteriovoracaceae bacterium]|nr:DnaA N-terminal domain-containing protein [Bacteriovoracaceae bacterium]